MKNVVLVNPTLKRVVGAFERVRPHFVLRGRTIRVIIIRVYLIIRVIIGFVFLWFFSRARPWRPLASPVGFPAAEHPRSCVRGVRSDARHVVIKIK